MIAYALIKNAWWKFLLLSLLSAWLSVINLWFGTTFFVAIAFGICVGNITGGVLYQANVPISIRYVWVTSLTAAVCVYMHFAFYASLNYLENMIFPWQIWTALKAIARTGSDVGGYAFAGRVDFHGSGYYTQWLIEGSVTAIAATVTALRKL